MLRPKRRRAGLVGFTSKSEFFAPAVDAIEANPKQAIAFLNRGNTHAQKGQYDRAIADYNEAIRLNPKDANAFYSRGNAYAQTGGYNYAIPDYDEAVQLNPNFAEAINRRAEAVARRNEFSSLNKR